MCLEFVGVCFFFFFKQKTAYEMRISDWSSDVCSSDLQGAGTRRMTMQVITPSTHDIGAFDVRRTLPDKERTMVGPFIFVDQFGPAHFDIGQGMDVRPHPHINLATVTYRSEEHTSELQSLMRISYAVFCLNKQKNIET